MVLPFLMRCDMDRKVGLAYDRGFLNSAGLVNMSLGVRKDLAEIMNNPLIQDSHVDNEESLQMLMTLLAIRDKATWRHSRRVTQLALRLAERVGFSEQEKRDVYIGALLHDVGKLGIQDKILFKPDKLCEEEYEQIKKHTEIGAALLNHLKGSQSVMPIILYHHERFDGKGYPEGLAGCQIPLTVRAVSIADAFEAMISDRPYRKPLNLQAALREISDKAGSQFDVVLSREFIKMIEEKVHMKVWEFE